VNALITPIIDGVIEREGRQYTNRASDAGGPTKFGITQRTLSRFRGRPVTPQEVAALTESEARSIYHVMFVTEPGYDQVLALSTRLGVKLIDIGVNCGTGRASEWFQRVLNVFNRQQSDYADIKVDGDVGPASIAALRAFLAKRGNLGETVMLRALNARQGDHYMNLAEKRAFDEDNVFGWFANRIGDLA